MNKKITIGFAAFILAASLAYADRDLFCIYSNFKGNQYYQTVTESMMQRSPVWDPETSPCPYALSNAVHLAKNAVKAKFPKISDWRLYEVTLTQSYSKGGDRWVYTVSLVNDYPMPSKMSVVVLLTGEVPEIVEEKPDAKPNPLSRQ